MAQSIQSGCCNVVNREPLSGLFSILYLFAGFTPGATQGEALSGFFQRHLDNGFFHFDPEYRANGISKLLPERSDIEKWCTHGPIGATPW